MRKSLCLLSVFSVFATAIAASRADDPADAKAIVAKAIKAAGGEEKLTKFNAHTVKETGTYYGMGDGVPYTGKYAVQYPHQFKMEIEGFFMMVLNGDKGWRHVNGETVEMTPEQLPALRPVCDRAAWPPRKRRPTVGTPRNCSEEWDPS